MILIVKAVGAAKRQKGEDKRVKYPGTPGI